MRIKLWPVLAAGSIILAAFIARVPLIASERLWPDEALYAYFARLIAAHPAAVVDPMVWADHLPVFPAVLALGSFLHPGIFGAHLFMVLINLLGVILVYGLGSALSGVFVGLLSAIFLATNFWYFVHAGMVLIDPLLLVAFLLLAFALFQVSLHPDSGGKRSVFVLGAAALFAAACKWYAIVLVVPMLLLYIFGAFPRERLRDRWRGAGVALAIAIVPLLPFLVYKAFFMKAHGGPVSYFPHPPLFYLFSFSRFVGGGWPTAIVCAAPFFLVRYPIRVKVLLYSMILIQFVVMSFVVEKDVRYILPAIPFLMILMAIVVKGLLELVLKDAVFLRIGKVLVLFLAALLFIPYLSGSEAGRGLENYTGFYAAGNRVREICPQKGVVFAGSLRAMHYAADLGSPDRIRPLPARQEDFISASRTCSGPVVLETDVWEYTQPEWIYPMTAEKMRSLRENGFVLDTVIRRPYMKNDSKVIFLFVKHPCP